MGKNREGSTFRLNLVSAHNCYRDITALKNMCFTVQQLKEIGVRHANHNGSNVSLDAD